MAAVKAALLALAFLCAMPARAGSFGVAPMRVDLGPGATSATITVTNDGDQALSFQATLSAWRQGPDGKDEYADSKDLIFFPQMFSVEPHDKRILRVGVKGPPPQSEKAYRLYIAELAAPTGAKPAGPAQVRVMLRFGIPVFVAPAAPKRDLAMDEPQVAAGKVLVTIRNRGNQGTKFDTLAVMRDKQVLAETNGWHVLPGAARTFEIAIDPARCAASGTLEVVANAEGTTLKRAFNAAPALCRHS